MQIVGRLVSLTVLLLITAAPSIVFGVTKG
jgi:hypothetical protein